MATFTLELNEVIELTGGTTEIVDGIRKMTGGNIGLGAYPIWDDAYRDTLNGKIIDHYYNREIGVETISMFQQFMRRRMNEIMPAYNLLYASTQIEFDPLKTINISTTSNETTNANANTVGTNDTSTDNNSTSRSVQSETPQTMLQANADYATSGVDVNGDTHVTATSTEDTTSSTDTDSSANSTTSGYQALPSELIMQYRETILNIDLMIINNLEDLFMLVWDNGDAMTY